MLDLYLFTNLAIMLFKSPFSLAPQGAFMPWKSKFFHNPTDTILADIDTEITPQNYTNLRLPVRLILSSDLFNQVVYLNTKLTLPDIFREFRTENGAFKPLLSPIMHSSTDADKLLFFLLVIPWGGSNSHCLFCFSQSFAKSALLLSFTTSNHCTCIKSLLS